MPSAVGTFGAVVKPNRPVGGVEEGGVGTGPGAMGPFPEGPQSVDLWAVP